jgi:hypothetical protein
MASLSQFVESDLLDQLGDDVIGEVRIDRRTHLRLASLDIGQETNQAAQVVFPPPYTSMSLLSSAHSYASKRKHRFRQHPGIEMNHLLQGSLDRRHKPRVIVSNG